MDLAQMRERMEQVLARVKTLAAQESHTEAEIKEANELRTEFNSLKSKIETKESMDEMLASGNSSAGRKAPNAGAGNAGIENKGHRVQEDTKAGFKNAGEFYKAVRDSKTSGVVSEQLVKAGLMERNGEDGGFLVPEDWRTEIEKKVDGDESLMNRTRQIITSRNTVHIPTIESAPWDGTGLQAYWEAERQPHRDSNMVFGGDTLKLHKLTAAVRVTEELLDDAPALESYINSMAPDALTYKINSAIVNGDGVGKPLGFLQATAGIIIPKESGQAADTIVYANVNNMIGRIMPNAFNRSIFLVNPMVLPALRNMSFDTTSPNRIPVYLPSSGIEGAPYGTLFGRPIFPMMAGMPALGDRGDIVLWDPQSYITAKKTTGIKASSSIHVFWNTDEVAFKFQMRLAGQTLYKKPVTTEFGNYTMSGIVSIADRA